MGHHIWVVKAEEVAYLVRHGRLEVFAFVARQKHLGIEHRQEGGNKDQRHCEDHWKVQHGGTDAFDHRIKLWVDAAA